MEAKANYTVVGLTVVVLTAALITGAIWLSMGFQKKTYHTYAVYMNESVSGLGEESTVRYNGVSVGYVKAIELDKTDPQRVRILLAIEENTPITISTTATLISQGITGVTYVGLSSSSPDLQPLTKLPDEPYPIIPAAPSIFSQLDRALKEVTVNINHISKNINQVFTPENLKNLRQTLAHLEKVTDIAVKNEKNLDASFKNADIMLKNLAQASKDLPQVIKNFNITAKNLSNTGKDISQTMISGKTTFNKINQQALPSAVNVLHNLENITANLEKVSALMRQNPSVIIRGTKPPPAGPGEHP